MGASAASVSVFQVPAGSLDWIRARFRVGGLLAFYWLDRQFDEAALLAIRNKVFHARYHHRPVRPAAMSTPPVVQQLVTPVPNVAGTVIPDVTAAQRRIYEEVLVHFSGPDYELPGVNEGNATLKEEEKFWLVCALLVRLGSCQWD